MSLLKLLKVSKPFACIRHTRSSSSATKWLCTSEHRNKITAATNELVHSVLSDKSFSEVSWIAEDLMKAINYTLSGGKKLRSAIVLDTYKNHETPDKVEEKLNLAYVVASCAELVQVNAIILDDVQDESMYRYSKSCWHRLPGVGLRAISDAHIVLGLLYEIIEKHFRNDAAFNDLMQQYNKAVLNTYMGQYMDNVISQKRKVYNHFTMDRFETILNYKTSFYTFKFPVNLGLILANVKDEKLAEAVDSIGNDLGKMYQMQNDYYDVYKDFATTGKDGTDITENKCTWLAVTALQRANAEQRALFSSNYGSNDPSHVEQILNLYKELKLDEVYYEENKKLLDQIESKIRDLPTGSRSVFYNMLNTISVDILEEMKKY